MFNLDDVENIEGDGDASEYYVSIQHAINSLDAWKFQGSYGRAMMDALKSGHCLLGRRHTHDYYGNLIPSRKQVKKGSMGSYEYVRKFRGSEWADQMSEV